MDKQEVGHRPQKTTMQNRLTLDVKQTLILRV
jgi:hypothetical protein